VTPAQRTSSRQPDIEALRASAALMVFASHLPWLSYFPKGLVPNAPAWLEPSAPLFGAGGFAVALFLVISGAGLCRTLFLHAPRIGSYLRVRLGKLFSTYWSIALPVFVVWILIGWFHPTMVQDAVLLLLGIGWKGASHSIFPSWWYMGIAWQVVAIAPLIVWGIRKIRPSGVLVITALVVLGTCYAIPALGVDYAERSLILARGLEVLGGVFLAFELWPEVRVKARVSRRHATFLVVATDMCLFGLLVFGYGERWLYRAVALALAAVIVYARPVERSGLRWLARAGVYAGGISFAFYLLHEPTIVLVRRLGHVPTGSPMVVIAAISFVAVTVLAVLFSSGEDRVRAAIRARGSACRGEAA
jgi:peptidoglycan/LPS O-acetylase OafA/YrhL